MSKNKSENRNWLRVRKFFNDIHLWGGLVSGIVVFIVCITGTIYVYNTEIREAASPEYYNVEPSGEPLQLDTLLALAKTSIQGEIRGVNVPFSKTTTFGVLYSKAAKDAKGSGEQKRGDKQRALVALAQRDSAGSQMQHSGSLVDKNVKVRSEKVTLQDRQTEKSDKSEQKAQLKSDAPKEAKKGGGRRRLNQMMVNPYTGEMIGDVTEVKTRTAGFMQKMFSLHRWLMLNEIENPIFDGVENRKLGSWISGTATLLFLLGVVSGLIIWFPKKLRGWKNGLKIRWSGNWKRINHDIHNTLGLYTWVVLFLMAITGPFWSFDWYREGWQKSWGTHASQKVEQNEKAKPLSQVIPGKAILTLTETVFAVNQALPYNGDITINFATDSVGTISVSKNRVGFFAPAASDKLILDQYTGEVLESDIFREKPLRERIGSSIKALHVGNVYGQFSKILYFIGCLVATSLPITGVLIWINKMKKPLKRKKK